MEERVKKRNLQVNSIFFFSLNDVINQPRFLGVLHVSTLSQGPDKKQPKNKVGLDKL